MEMHLLIKMNENLFLKDPQETEAGKKILYHSVLLLHDIGLENFTFKKLAQAADTTEAVVYRYFENKHRLLVYLVAWYWNWLDYRIIYITNNIRKPALKLKKIIRFLASPIKDDHSISYINESLLHQIVVEQGAKAYLNKQVTVYNQQHVFKPIKDLISRIAGIMLECNPELKYPRSLSSTLIEMAHLQKFFKNNLPSLTDFPHSKDDANIVDFLDELVFCGIKKL